MTVQTLGRMTRVDLRDVFANEPGDFTPWLAQEENLKLLGDAIGIELELTAQEKDVGPFRADILCKDTTTDNWVVIENQLERTNHSHLGQLLTYAAGLNAVSIVWVADSFAEDHRAALDWLNERTDKEINFFGLEIELWKIGDSLIAPKFNIKSEPNNWARSVKSAAEGSTELSDRRQTRLRFWQAFKAFMESNNSTVRCQKPTTHVSMHHSIGRSGFHLASVASISSDTESGAARPEIRVELVLHGKLAKEHFEALEKGKSQIEKQMGSPLVWYNPDDTNKCRIYVAKEGSFMDSDHWLEQHEWLKEKLETFHRVFAPIVKNLE